MSQSTVTRECWPGGSEGSPGLSGLSLRDYFAGQALAQVLLADFADDPRDFDATRSARTAYRIADAMLKERAQ